MLALPCAAIVSFLGVSVASAQAAAQEVTLVDNGRPAMPIVAGSVTAPVDELRDTVQRISGAELETAGAQEGAVGIYVGTVGDFPWLELDGADDLGEEGFIFRSDGTNLYLVAGGELGVKHAVTTFLHRLGARWFFPGEVWAIVPELATVRGAWDERQKPAYRGLRHLWYGFGAYGPSRDDYDQWMDRNRMGGPEPVGIGHAWYGLDNENDFDAHPEWFALVEGERRPSKPCFSHPKVIERIIDHVRDSAARGDSSVSLSPPDGLGYCECDRCRDVFQGGGPYEAHGTLFAERPDGLLVNITSETLFNAVRQAAEAVVDDYPDFMVGCYGYSAYSHPPSFDLPANVYIQTTTAFRRTPLDLEEQITLWGERAQNVGIREYWSVYQWDWDNPDPGKLRPDQLRGDLRFFHQNNVIAMNAESGNQWGPRGLGYYVGSQLLWDLDVDVDAVVRDFYEKAFGPAAGPMQRWYVRWYGDSVAVLDDAGAMPDPERTVWDRKDLEGSRRTLAEGFADLDDAAARVESQPGARDRVDHLRLYAYYLYLRLKQWEASAAEDDVANLAAIREETRFGGRLTYTNMIHARPLIGKAFHRRFSADSHVWEGVESLAQPNEGDRVVDEPPSRDELIKRWTEAKADLGVE